MGEYSAKFSQQQNIHSCCCASDSAMQASRRKIDCILVWKIDRAFRSVAHMATTFEQLRRWNVGLRSYSEPWLDTLGTSPVGDLMLNILASFAQFEKALIAERVRAGMTRAKRQAVHGLTR